MKEERKANILFGKSGSGGTTTRIVLPVPWVRELGATADDREVKISIDEDKIIIKKEEYISSLFDLTIQCKICGAETSNHKYGICEKCYKEKRFCTVCGKKLDSNWKFCSFCGKKI